MRRCKNCDKRTNKKIADAIRKWSISTEKYTLNTMPNAISNIRKGDIHDIRSNSSNFSIQLAGNDSLAFYFVGTGFEISFMAAVANVYWVLYDANDYTLGEYEYGNGKTMLYAAKRSSDIGTGPLLTKYMSYRPDEEHVNAIVSDGFSNLEYGNYLVLITKTTGTENVNICSMPRIIV